MATTAVISRKGTIRIPTRLRRAYRLEAGVRVVVTDTGDGLLLRSGAAVPRRRFTPAAAKLRRREDAIDARAVRERLHRPDPDVVPWDQAKSELGLA